jgi:hypothetical protein
MGRKWKYGLANLEDYTKKKKSCVSGTVCQLMIKVNHSPAVSPLQI